MVGITRNKIIWYITIYLIYIDINLFNKYLKLLFIKFILKFYFDILFGILSDILSNILFDIIFSILFGRSSGILFNMLSGDWDPAISIGFRKFQIEI